MCNNLKELESLKLNCQTGLEGVGGNPIRKVISNMLTLNLIIITSLFSRKKRSRSRSRHKRRSRSRSRDRHHKSRRHRSRSKDRRSKSKDRKERHRTRSRDRSSKKSSKCLEVTFHSILK